MVIDENKIIYIAKSDGKGVENKIKGFCNAAAHAGYNAEFVIESTPGLAGIRRQICKMISSDAKYIVMRSPTRDSFFFIFCFIIIRLQGKVLIIDQPSPASTYVNEVNTIERSFLNKFAKKLLTYIGCPFTFMFATRIVQYGDESTFFRFFSGNKILLIGNGIDVERISLRKKEYPDGKEQLSLVGVSAQIEDWHGFDRVVCAIGKWKKMGKKPNVTFNIVGESSTPQGQNIKKLVKKFGIEDNVKFCGFQSSDGLYEYYSKASLGVASLGLFRNGLSTASVLKAREYCLAGIPFIASGIDPDFPDSIPFRFVVSHDETIDDIIDVFQNYAERRKSFTDENIRQYAVERLSFDSKFKEIMRGL